MWMRRIVSASRLPQEIQASHEPLLAPRDSRIVIKSKSRTVAKPASPSRNDSACNLVPTITVTSATDDGRDTEANANAEEATQVKEDVGLARARAISRFLGAATVVFFIALVGSVGLYLLLFDPDQLVQDWKDFLSSIIGRDGD